MASHQDPSYYAEYYLRWIEEHIDVLVSKTTELNHDLSVRIIGKGSSMFIVERISATFSKKLIYYMES